MARFFIDRPVFAIVVAIVIVLLGAVTIPSAINFMSVAAIVIMPPTLIASIYGMNFKIMPERDWSLGYPLSLILMVLFAVLPYLWFKRKGWL